MDDILQISLDRIPDEGLEIITEIEPDMLKVEDNEDLHLTEARLEGRLERVGAKKAVFRGRATGVLTVECSLGLALFPFPVDELMTVYFQPPPSEKEIPLEIRCEEADLEVYYLLDSDIVDLATPLRDQLLLAVPIQPRCPGECLGEDPEQCRRLKEGESYLTEEEPDPRWASLKGWGQAER